jgi:TM2 domain-containing membrane protein YozV
MEKSTKNWWVAFILCWFWGIWGAHRFYAGKIGTGVAQLFTFGGCGIWALIDLIKILMQKFEDKEGKVIMR